MNKKYTLDTCSLMEREDCVEILRNGEENQINIPMTVINELDGLVKDNHKRPKATKVVENLLKNKDWLNFTGDIDKIVNNDDRILKSVQNGDTLVTNDLVLQLKSYICGVEVEEFKQSLPFNSESELYSGFIDWYKSEEYINNCFYFKEGKLFYWNGTKERCIDYEHDVWKINPRDVYQSAAFELLTNRNVHLTTLQAKAGTGKSLCSLASALYMTFEKKLYRKVVVVKPGTETSETQGYLPGNIQEKYGPHWKPLYHLLLKLHDLRPCNKMWLDPDNPLPEPNPRFLEFLPLNYLRGDNIEHSYVVISEAQNIPRDEMRTLLTRMGENCKVIVEGDTSQVDHPRCNNENNGLNWIVKLCKGRKNYGHLKLNSKKTRGPICDMITEVGL